VGEHEKSTGETDEWYTPPELFEILDLTFDLDPCSPGKDHWVPAKKIYTKEDDGLSKKWNGLIFMNPPFGKRHGHLTWLDKFLEHGNGIAIVRAYTSAYWFHRQVVQRAETLFFPNGKTKFVRADGSIGAAPGHGIVLIGMGEISNNALKKILPHKGWYVDNKPTHT